MTRTEINKTVAIIKAFGGYREKALLNNCTFEKSETWNDTHKVVNVLSLKEDTDGYRDGCQVDIVGKSICG